MSRHNLRRHIIRGNLIDGPYVTPPTIQIDLFHLPRGASQKLPKDGEFNGSLKMRVAIKTSKEKIKWKTHAWPERVKLTIKPRDGSKRIFEVSGTGSNEFGTFKLYGTATKNSSVVEDDPTYKISIHKSYVGPCVVTAPAPTPADDKGPDYPNRKKRSGADESAPGSTFAEHFAEHFAEQLK